MKYFKVRVYDIHYTYFYEDEGLIFKPHSQDLKCFNYYIDLEKSPIIAFREFTLIDLDDNPNPCTQITFDDGSQLYSVHSIDTFKKSLDEFLTQI